MEKINSETKIMKSDVKKFWLDFFPEVGEDEFENILDKVGRYDLETICDYYNNYDQVDDAINIEEYVDMKNNEFVANACKDSNIDKVFIPYILPILNKHISNINEEHFEKIYNKERFYKQIIVELCGEVFQWIYKSVVFDIMKIWIMK